MKEVLISIKNRLYSDYILSNRFYEYEKFIEIALKNNYIITSVIGYYDLLHSDNITSTSKVIIMRHDIDTDKEAAKCFFEVEKKYNVQSSFYFRLKTLDPNLMYAIENYGSEASYHFEEISTFSKENRIKDKSEIFFRMPQIQDMFIRNYLDLKDCVHIPMRSVAAHGDFVNRHLGVVNYELLTPEVRKVTGIEIEAYDSVIKNDCISISDTMSPKFWTPVNPIEIIKKGERKINVLTHPRHWRSNCWINTKDNVGRLFEGLAYRYF